MSKGETAKLAGPGERPRIGNSPAGEERIAQAIRCFQAGNGREAAFRLLYETYFRPIHRFFDRKGLAAEDCLDLTQETFLRVYKGLNGYEHRQRFVAWLYRVATTTHLKWLRKANAAKRSAVDEVSRDAMQYQDPSLEVAGAQLDDAIRTQRHTALRAAVAEMPEQMRDCLVLRLYHELTYTEIATVKQLSAETVKAHLFRARKRLAQQLGDDPLEEQEARAP